MPLTPPLRVTESWFKTVLIPYLTGIENQVTAVDNEAVVANLKDSAGNWSGTQAQFDALPTATKQNPVYAFDIVAG